jgi:hypothetical protein
MALTLHMKCFALIPRTRHFAAFLDPLRFLDLLLLHGLRLADISLPIPAVW